MQGFTLLLQKLLRIGSRLQGVAQVRDPHKSDGMLEFGLAANLKSSPPGVRDPTVLFGLAFLQ